MGEKINYLFITLVALAILASACGVDQLSELQTLSFSTTPKCGQSEQTISFQNTNDKELVIQGIAFSPGTNGGGNFSLQGIKVGAGDETGTTSGGSIGETKVPAGEIYKLRVRFNPTSETTGTPHTAIVDIVYSSPVPGMTQVKVNGASEGELNCPKVVPGESVGLDGPVNLTIDKMVASTNATAESLSTDNGTAPFTKVTFKNVPLSVTDGTIVFPKIASTDNFFLPTPDKTKAPGIANLVKSNTNIVTSAAVTGTYDSTTGKIVIPNVVVNMKDDESEIQITITLTTDMVDILRTGIPQLSNANFVIIDGKKVAGTPVNKDTGAVVLVGSTSIKSPGGYARGKLSVADGTDIVVRIEATILCGNGTTTCTLPINI